MGELAADLEVVLTTGINQAEATRLAFSLLAETIFAAWAEGATPVRTMPEILRRDDQGV